MNLTFTMPGRTITPHVPLPRSGERLGEGVAGNRASHPHPASPSIEGEEHEGAPLFDLRGWPTAAGRAWLAAQWKSRPPALSGAEGAPAVETDDNIRGRMTREIERAMTFGGCVTERDLERAGFSAAQIDTHFPAARDAACVGEL